VAASPSDTPDASEISRMRAESEPDIDKGDMGAIRYLQRLGRPGGGLTRGVQTPTFFGDSERYGRKP